MADADPLDKLDPITREALGVFATAIARLEDVQKAQGELLQAQGNVQAAQGELIKAQAERIHDLTQLVGVVQGRLSARRPNA